jgi:hypothetical protein
MLDCVMLEGVILEGVMVECVMVECVVVEGVMAQVKGRKQKNEIERFEPGTTRTKPNAVPFGMTRRNIRLN